MRYQNNKNAVACPRCDETNGAIKITLDQAMACSLCTVHLRDAQLDGIDIIKGPMFDLDSISMADLHQAIQDIKKCHALLYQKSLISPHKRPALRLDVEYV